MRKITQIYMLMGVMTILVYCFVLMVALHITSLVSRQILNNSSPELFT